MSIERSKNISLILKHIGKKSDDKRNMWKFTTSRTTLLGPSKKLFLSFMGIEELVKRNGEQGVMVQSF
jgi:hypothetical protein